MKDAKMNTKGTYRLRIVATGDVEPGYTAPQQVLTVDWTVKLCDHTIATLGDYTNKPKFSPYTPPAAAFGSKTCDPCIVPNEVWAPTGGSGPYFQFYTLTYADIVDPTIDRAAVCPVTVTTTSSDFNSITQNNGVYESVLKSPQDQTDGTYTLDLVFSAHVISGSPAVTKTKSL